MRKAQNSTLDLLSCRIEDTSKGRHEKTLGHETTKLKRCGLQWKRGLRQNKRAHTLGSWWDHSGTKVRDEKMTQILRCSKWDNWRRSQSRLWNNNELRKEGKPESVSKPREWSPKWQVQGIKSSKSMKVLNEGYFEIVTLFLSGGMESSGDTEEETLPQW